MDVLVHFNGFQAKVVKGTYGEGVMALKLVDPDDGSAVATATVNIPGRRPPDGHVFIKNWAENSGIIDVLSQAGVLRDTGHRVKTGYVEAHLCQLLK